MKLMKTTLRKLWRLTKTTSTIVGLAVMVGLVAGVASLAVAQKSPSGGTTASPLFKGVENIAATTTTLINTGRGAAMSMHVQPGNAPLTVNDDAGTATNLSADTVDGKDSTAFVSATNGKAPDSDRLDGKDSTEFAAASIGTAYTAKTDSVTIPNDGNVRVVSKAVPAGSYAVNANVQLRNADDDDDAIVGCSLFYSGTIIATSTDEVLVEWNGGLITDDEDNRSEPFPFQTVLSDVSGGTISVRCDNTVLDSDLVEARNAVITAIRVGSVH
jgi:hypothetical protein